MPFKHETPFTESGHKAMNTRFNRAAKNLISEVDVEYLESLPARNRLRQFETFAAEVSSLF